MLEGVENVEALALRGIAAVLLVMAVQWLLLSCWAVLMTAYEWRRTGKLPPLSSVLRHLQQLARLTWPRCQRRGSRR